MADWPTTANGTIEEVDGPFYHAHFAWVPRVGELISLYPFLEVEQGNQASYLRYEVVQVVHHMHDVTNKHPEGAHTITVLVKRSANRYFDGGNDDRSGVRSEIH
jgi:hypothetical protein